jgi:hypothetical protein
MAQVLKEDVRQRIYEASYNAQGLSLMIVHSF